MLQWLVIAFLIPFHHFSTVAAGGKNSEQELEPQTLLQKLHTFRENEKFLWYVPHNGFGNQMRGFRNALRIAGILNRTLIVPPLLHSFENGYGTCLGRVPSPQHASHTAWTSFMEKLESATYLSMADIVDVSGIDPALVRTVDLRIFAALRCGINVTESLSNCAWCGPLLQALNQHIEDNFPRQLSNRDRLIRCGVDLGGVEPNAVFRGYKRRRSLYMVKKNCMTSTFTFRRSENGSLEASIPEVLNGSCPQGPYFFNVHNYQVSLAKDRIRDNKPPLKIVNVLEYLGTEGSEAENAEVIQFGSTFDFFDFAVPTGDSRVDALSCVTNFLPFNREIMRYAAKYAKEVIAKPYFCLHFRGGDAYFKENRDSNLGFAKYRVSQLRSTWDENEGSLPQMFLMSDMMSPKWQAIFSELFSDYKIHFSKELWPYEKNIKVGTFALANGVYGNRLSSDEQRIVLEEYWDEDIVGKVKETGFEDHDMKVYLDQAVCACSTSGLIEDWMSTISSNIVRLRAGHVCKW